MHTRWLYIIYPSLSISFLYLRNRYVFDNFSYSRKEITSARPSLGFVNIDISFKS